MKNVYKVRIHKSEVLKEDDIVLRIDINDQGFAENLIFYATENGYFATASIENVKED